ncbi:MAG TPA: thiamine pyrophosphate-dependent enzyme [Micropepsaceae bacterium]|nr:thiamine pyrophosphate-dependent enzyme [Micropepsaceae bacterium]
MTDSAAPDAILCDAALAQTPEISRPLPSSVPVTVLGAEAIVETLVAHETKHVFIFPGGTIAPILDVIEKQTDIEIVCPRNEQGAGYAALAYAALTGKPAIFMVTSGPGVTNAITPIADAYYDNLPLIVLTGQVGTADMRGTLPVKQRGFQEVDTVDLVKPIAKAAFLVKDVHDLPAIMELAFELASSGRKGPVVVDLPMNVQRASMPRAEANAVPASGPAKSHLPKKPLAQLAQWIRSAKRPVILAGGGVVASGAEAQLRQLAEGFIIPVAMSMPGMGAYPSAAPLSLGLCGYAGSQYANLAIHNCDLLIGIGTTFHVRQTGSLPEQTAPGAKIARIDIDKGELAHSRVPLDLKIDADAKAALAALNALLENGTPPETGRTDEWLATIAHWKAAHPVCVGRGPKLKPQAVIAAADRICSSGPVIVTTGVGQHQVWVPRHFRFDNPSRRLLTSSGHGTMGYDLPAAIGAKIAHPDAQILCFVGDGSFQMNIQELATIAERNLDIKIIVLDNHALNIVAQFQRQNWQSHPSTGAKYNPDFAAIAKAYGIRSFSIASPESMEKTLAEGLNHKGPALIHCEVDPEEDLLPMLLGGHRLDDMTCESSFG